MKTNLAHNGEWVCTDEDNAQWGRQISENVFEFKEDQEWPDGYKETIQETIDLTEYTEKQIEDTIKSYYPGKLKDLIDSGEIDNWIIAECLFEMRMF